ncbi:Vacuolar transporter chaperone 1 [Smittium culicis]|uniref:Vacuolar transporter chaperone 1 n=1 Tax=Smittium culicis TaxID=133412 RepID=A0A1R1XXY9_9FUNG|nr:Vacuolar transporter chaperone 1 [Smittium culicis]
MPKFQNNPNAIATKGNSLMTKSNEPVFTETAPLLPNSSSNATTVVPPPASSSKAKQIDPLSAAESQPVGTSQAPKKRLAIPVRVEPKVFFANERTFLSWLNVSIILGTISLGLVSFGDRNVRIAGYTFTALSILTMFYSLYMYQKRANMILARDPGPYDSRNGPTILVILLVTLVAFNFYIRFQN